MGTHEHIGATIRHYRRHLDRTQWEVAGQIGRSAGWLSSVEQGRANPTTDDLRALAIALGLPRDLFVAERRKVSA
jgi:transcriptional regulator with XRE-family HTH domain